MAMRYGLVLPLLVFMAVAPAGAQECKPRVEHVGNVVQGKRVYSHWLIGHTPWRWATISFRYELTYIDANNKEDTITGRFSQLISGREEEYVELKNLRSQPTYVTKTKFSELTCEQ